MAAESKALRLESFSERTEQLPSRYRTLSSPQIYCNTEGAVVSARAQKGLMGNNLKALRPVRMSAYKLDKSKIRITYNFELEDNVSQQLCGAVWWKACVFTYFFHGVFLNKVLLNPPCPLRRTELLRCPAHTPAELKGHACLGRPGWSTLRAGSVVILTTGSHDPRGPPGQDLNRVWLCRWPLSWPPLLRSADLAAWRTGLVIAPECQYACRPRMTCSLAPAPQLPFSDL